MAKRTDPVGHFYDQVTAEAKVKTSKHQIKLIEHNAALGAAAGAIMAGGLGPAASAISGAVGGVGGGAVGSVVGAVQGAHEAGKIKKAKIQAVRAYKGVMK